MTQKKAGRPTKMLKTHNMIIRVPSDLYQAATDASNESGIPLSELVRQALTAHLKNRKWIE